MRVAHIIKVTQIGGAERHLLILLPALKKRGIDPHLIMMVEPDNPMTSMAELAEAAGITVHSLTIRRDYDPIVGFQLLQTLRKIKPDLVHTHLIHADLFGITAARLGGYPVITGRHNDDDFRSQTAVKTGNALLWQLARGGIAISDAIKRFTIEVEGAPADKVRVVPYGIPHQSPTPDDLKSARAALRHELNLSPDTLLVGMVCRLVEQKGVSYGIEAFKAVLETQPDTHLVIAGDGDQRETLEKQVNQLGITERVHFLGWRDDAPGVIAALDIFLMPSLWEGFGLVLLEAMSRRVPVIASDVSAIPEVVSHGETGLLVPPRHIDGLRDAMLTLLTDRPLRLHLGMMAEDRVEQHFSADHMADTTISVYREFLGR